MPNLLIGLPPASLVPNRNKVSITGPAGSVTLSITRPAVEWANLADDWESVYRVNDIPILDRVGSKLRTFTIGALLTHEPDESPSSEPDTIAGEFAMLVNLANPQGADRSVAVAYDPLTPLLSRSGGWVITELTVRSIRRRPSDNAITRAEVNLTFTEASRPPAVASPTSPTSPVAVAVGPPPPPATGSAPPTPAQRRYTVKAGDTLWGIAQTFYGNGAYWNRIADANGIDDPRRVAVGTTLTIP